MSTLSYRYSIDYHELVETIAGEFDGWLRYELTHGGATEVRVDHRISELVVRHVPSSPHQLLELALQCELLLDVELDDPLFGSAPDDAYQALLISVGRYLSGMLWTIWEAQKEEATGLAVADATEAVAGDGRPGGAGDNVVPLGGDDHSVERHDDVPPVA